MFRTLPLFVVDAFTNKPFSGNPAAVCLIPFDEALSSDTMQKIAAEMNLSETAFVSPVAKDTTFESGSEYYLRWFSPACEIALCGHATLATASILMNIYGNSASLEFTTQSGKLKANKLENGRISIDLPLYESKNVDSPEISEIVTLVVGNLPVQEVLLSESKKLLIRLSDNLSRKHLEEINPNFRKLLSLKNEQQIIAVIVTLQGCVDPACVSENGEPYDFISRSFAPWLGIDEDPVTGASHSVLSCYWSKALKYNTLFARQCSSRGGDLQIEVKEERVLLSGDAFLVVQGKITC